MDQVCLVLPVREGKSATARDFMRELETDRKAEYAVSERRIGIDKEAWYLASTPSGDQLVAYMESPDFNRALAAFSQSKDPFDLWFKRRLDEVDRARPQPPAVRHDAAGAALELHRRVIG